jgi:hypothetical protein
MGWRGVTISWLFSFGLAPLGHHTSDRRELNPKGVYTRKKGKGIKSSKSKVEFRLERTSEISCKDAGSLIL